MSASSEELLKCVVCLEHDRDPSGVTCGQHYLCAKDLNSFLNANVLPQQYKLRANKCHVWCPVDGCSKSFRSITVFLSLTEEQTRLRFISTMESILMREGSGKTSNPEFSEICKAVAKYKSALLDCMVLKCPGCHEAVDPNPDACAAIMCLSCGHYYCNCCFEGFGDDSQNVGQGAQTSSCNARAHIHAAKHHPKHAAKSSGGEAATEAVTEADAFVPPETVRVLQQTHQLDLLTKCIVSLTEQGGNEETSNLIEIASLLCYRNIMELFAPEPGTGSAAASNSAATPNAYKATGGVFPMQYLWDAVRNALMNKTRTTFSIPAVAAASATDSALNRQPDEASEADQSSSAGGRGAAAAVSRSSSNGDTCIKKMGGKQLFNAVKTHNAVAVTQLFTLYNTEETVLDVDYVDAEASGYPVALLALVTKQLEVTKLLLESGADVMNSIVAVPGKPPDMTVGRKILYTLIELGHFGLAQLAIEKSVKKFEKIRKDYELTGSTDCGVSRETAMERSEYSYYGNTILETKFQRKALHVAAIHNVCPLAHYLVIRCKADVEATEGELNLTPLQMAMALKSTWFAETLITTFGCKVVPTPLTSNQPAKGGDYPIWKIVETGNLHLLKASILVVQRQYGQGSKERAHNALYDFLVNMRNNTNGMNVLHFAAFFNQQVIVEFLLDLFHNAIVVGNNIPRGMHYVNVYSREGFSPLACALESKSEDAALAILDSALLQTPDGQCITIANNVNNQLGRSALFLAIEHGFLSVAEKLINPEGKIKLDVNDPVTLEDSGDSALMVAAMYNTPATNRIIDLLLFHGCNINVGEKKFRYTPLMMAVQNNNLSMVHKLIRPHKSSEHSKSLRIPGVHRCNKCHTQIHNVQTRNIQNQTATFIACTKGSVEIVELLLCYEFMLEVMRAKNEGVTCPHCTECKEQEFMLKAKKKVLNTPLYENNPNSTILQVVTQYNNAHLLQRLLNSFGDCMEIPVPAILHWCRQHNAALCEFVLAQCLSKHGKV